MHTVLFFITKSLLVLYIIWTLPRMAKVTKMGDRMLFKTVSVKAIGGGGSELKCNIVEDLWRGTITVLSGT